MKARRWLSLAQRFVPAARRGDLVLAYHLVGAGTSSPVDVPVDDFRRQLDCLASNFELSTLTRALTTPGQQRPRAILTFDDAYANFAKVVWPILAERGVPAVLYVPVGFVRGSAGPPLRGADLPACTFADLRELAAAGVEIGSHGVNHVNLRRVTEDALTREVQDSRTELEQVLGREVPSFCYPQAKLDARVERVVARHYQSAVAAGGRRHLGRNLHKIPRFPVRRDERDFESMVASSIWLSEALASGVRQWRR